MFCRVLKQSGLKFYLGKSEMVPIGEVPKVEALADILGCKTFNLPMKYLGLPLGAKYKSEAICDLVLEKLERRLAMWKKFFFIKGRENQFDKEYAF